MGKKKKFLLSLVIQLILAAAIVAVLYTSFVDDLNISIYEHKRYAAVPQAWTYYCVSNAMFIPAVMWLGIAGLMWVATTGFFDIFSYAFKSLIVLFSPLKRPSEMEHFFEYKQSQEEKRSGASVSYTMLIVGVALLLGALAFNIAHNNALEPYLNSAAHQQTQQEIAQEAADAADDALGSELSDENPDVSHDTTGGNDYE